VSVCVIVWEARRNPRNNADRDARAYLVTWLRCFIRDVLEGLDIKLSAGSAGTKEPRIVSDLIVSDLTETVTRISRAC